MPYLKNRTLLRAGGALLVALIVALGMWVPAWAGEASGWQAADEVQKALNQAPVALLSGDQAAALGALSAAQRAYDTQLAPLAREHSGAALAAGGQALRQAMRAAQTSDLPDFAAAGGTIQTALYQIGYQQTLAALDQGDAESASEWLLLRAFRQVSRFERLNSNATQALADLRAGKGGPAAARASVQVDLLDTYQARLSAALHDLAAADTRQLAAGRAQHAALAAGYFAILAPTYAEQRGGPALQEAERAFAHVLDTVRAGQPVKDLLPQLDAVLRGFRAAPLSPAEQSRRAGQLLRFIALVPVEYARGVKNGQVTIPLEIQEATTFRDGAAAAFSDLRSLLDTRDSDKTQQVADALAALEQQLLDAKDQSQVADPEEIQAGAVQIVTLLRQSMPAEWQQHDSGGRCGSVPRSRWPPAR